MDKKLLEEIRDNQKEMSKDLTDIKVTVAKQEVHLAENKEDIRQHIKRTNILEDRMEKVNHHISMVDGVFKFLGVLATIGAVIRAIMIFKH